MYDMTTALQAQPAAPQQTGMMQIAVSREVQEVQGQIIIARQFPRDVEKVKAAVLADCKRIQLAESAMYAFPRGNETVTGPSIRLAEAIAQKFGNLIFGVRELRQENGESVAQAFAWDIETNVRQEKIFTVPHVRNTKKGSYKLTETRDIYELVANNGARRLRACILGLIPGDIIEAAIEQCENTLASRNDRPLAARIQAMLEAFEKVGVSRTSIENKLKRKADAITEHDLVGFQKIYKSITDGFAKAYEHFPDMPAPDQPAQAMNQAFAGTGQ